jgi:hypothetical protein
MLAQVKWHRKKLGRIRNNGTHTGQERLRKPVQRSTVDAVAEPGILDRPTGLLPEQVLVK